MAEHNALGKWGEELAERYLLDHGFYIRDRDWHDGPRDIDIVAVSEQQNMILFIEVKTRASDEVASPLLAVNRKKMRSLGLAANAYIKQQDISYEVRFDILTIVGTDAASARIEYIEDAFNPLLL